MGYKVLLADDSITIQKVIGIIFANEDYDLTVVDNGNTALEKAKEIRPDVILVDALMPGKSGYEVCREVRQDESLKRIPMLLLVGAFEPFDEEKARNSGADDHISKPFESQLLIEKVKKLIDLGEERARAHDQADVISPAAGPSDFLNLGVETVPAAEAGAFISQGADSGTKVEKSSDALYFDSLEIVEAAPEDDLWGVFEVEEVVEGEDVQLGEALEEDELQPEVVDSVEEIEPFVFKEDDSVQYGNGSTISLGEYPETETAPITAGETFDPFVLKEEPVSEGFGVFSHAAGPAVEIVEEVAPASACEVEEAKPEISDVAEVPIADILGFGSGPASEATFQNVGQELRFAPGEEPVSAPEVSAQEEKVAPEVVSGEAGGGTISLSEDQLASMLSKVSREIIERIAWEVVPDLAETIIREEIRKIKEGY